MTALLIGAVGSVVVAFLLLRAIDLDCPAERLIAESLILGCTLPAFVLYLLSIASIPWSREVLASCGIVAITGMLLVTRGRWRRSVPGAERESDSGGLAFSVPLALLTLALLVGYTQFAFVTAGVENDFIGIWGVKAAKFYEANGIDWVFLTSPWRGYAHPDYPILVPLIFSSIAVAAGEWSESILGMIYPVLSLGGLLLVRSEVKRQTSSSPIVWLCVLGAVPFVFSPWIGLADGPLALLVLAAMLRIGRWLETERGSDLSIGGIFLGLAMFTKNEGVSLGIVALVALVWITRNGGRRKLVGIWPAIVIALPWAILRSVHGLSTDLFQKGFLSRLISRLFDAGFLKTLGGYLVDHRPGQWLVLALLLAAVVVWRKSLTIGEGFILAVCGLQVPIYLMAYLVTPLPVDWHVRWSWERLISQIALSAVVVGLSVLVRQIDGRSDSAGRGFLAFLRAGPEVEDEKPDPDTDR